MTLKLYELANAHRDLFERIEECEGELTPELEAELDAITGGLSGKVDSCCMRIAEYERSAVAVQAEIDRLKARQNHHNYDADRLRSYVMACLERAELTKVETARFTARIQLNNPTANLLGDPDDIPEPYRREKTVTTTTVSFDKAAAIADHKAGKELPARVEIRRGKKLVIK